MRARVAVLHSGASSGPGSAPAVDPRSRIQSLKTVAAVAEALRAIGCDTVLVEAGPDLVERIREARPSVVFNLCTGIRRKAEQAYVARLLEMGGVPFTGSGFVAHALGMHKPTTKTLLRAAGIPTPDFQVFESGDDELDASLSFPLIVKPVQEGSSVGISERSVVTSPGALRREVRRTISRYAQAALVEEYIEGRELTVGIVGNGRPRVLPVEEMVFHGTNGRRKLYTYEIKCRDAATPVCPANLSPAEARLVRQVALTGFWVLGCRGYARVDIRLSREGIPFVLELNTLPGLEPGHSELPRMAEAGGIGYSDLVRLILGAALERVANDAFRCSCGRVYESPGGEAASGWEGAAEVRRSRRRQWGTGDGGAPWAQGIRGQPVQQNSAED